MADDPFRRGPDQCLLPMGVTVTTHNDKIRVQFLRRLDDLRMSPADLHYRLYPGQFI